MVDKTDKIERIATQKNKPAMKHLYKLWRFIFSATKGISCIYLGLFIVLSLLRPGLAFIWKNYIAEVEYGASVNLVSAVILLISYWAINYLAGLIESYMAVDGDGDLEQLDAVQANRQQELMHTKIFKKISSISSEYFEISKINDETQQVLEFIGDPYSGVNREVMLKSYVVIAKAVSLITIAMSLYIFNPWLCLILILAPLPVLWTSTIGEKLRFKFKQDHSQYRRMIKYYQDFMISKSSKEIKILGLHDFFYNKWKTAADEYTIKEKSLIRRQTLLNTVNTLIVNTIHIGSMVFVIVLMAMGEISLGISGAVISLIGTLVQDTTQLLSSFASLCGKKEEANQFQELMNIPDQKDEGLAVDSFKDLRVKNLKYRYPLTNRYVLDGINFTVHKGEKIAFVGENGEGKTTMVKLIMGLLEPSDGGIEINGISTEKCNPIDRYRIQSTVTQDPSHYVTFTIKENVFIGDTLKSYDDKEVDNALEFANLTDYDKDVLLGKDVGGTDLSGGEWQKLAIARAAYRNRDFIILDEPTSNLDPLAETEIFQKYIALAENKTVIFVTHRISVAALANRIIVFKNGKIQQDGSHDELIKQDGEYARLYQEQSKWYNR